MSEVMLWCRECGAVWHSSPARELATQYGCLRCDGPLVRVIESEETVEARRATRRRQVGPSLDIRVANAALELMRAGERRGILELHHADFVLELPLGILPSQRYSGHEGLTSALHRLDRDWLELRLEVHTLCEVDDGVVAEGAISGRRKDGHSGRWPAAWHFELDAGLIRRTTFSFGAEAEAACEAHGVRV